MLSRVALHQSRLRMPGVLADSRGVLLGQEGVLLFSSLDRLVAFLRAAGDDGVLADLVPSLELREVVTARRTREVLVRFDAESSRRMDRVAGFARLAGGLAFTGTDVHFVRYRDATAPCGFDVDELAEATSGGVVLYDVAFTQSYTLDREVRLYDLVRRLSLERRPRAQGAPKSLYVVAELGVGRAVLSYLARYGVRARAALAEWVGESVFDDRPVARHVVDVQDAPERIVSLLASIPGVTVLAPVGARAAVALGHRHPLPLDVLEGVFPEGALALFVPGEPVRLLDPLPPFASVGSLVRLRIGTADALHASEMRPVEASGSLDLVLQLAPDESPPTEVVATVVPIGERDRLARLFSVLPPRVLARLRVAVSNDAIYVLDPSGLEALPLGRAHRAVAEGIYLPVGRRLVPEVSKDVLVSLLPECATAKVFLDPEGPARIVPDAAFTAVDRRQLRALAGERVEVVSLPTEDPRTRTLVYDEATRFPLREAETVEKEAKEP